MTRLTSFFAIATLCCFTSSADAQVSQPNSTQVKAEQRDTVQAQAISIMDLEMIVPENRLMPEAKKEEAKTDYVESPLSSTHPKRKAQVAKLTAKDLEMLENIKPSEQADETPSR